ncbi:unnamed protein product [Rhizoctonia solani]|uniref:DUF7082 domain-containing protein n=1 Tax=Rhizoctonia solani TaxID=456999 RepID=A0A8H3ANP0_9AGAM|nr:unnamed protein product [Rhizoctonia solani]CAE6452392.1 unnamed protein product [Rhizoctonia solani]
MPPDSYDQSNAFDTFYPTAAAPSFGPRTGILPQYSHEGRTGPEFNYNPTEGYADDDDDRPAIALGATTKILGRARLTIEVPSHDATEALIDERDTESPTTAKSFIGQRPGEDTYQVSLRFLGNLKSMAEDWTPEEINDQRRIVEFFCVRTRGRIDVSFAPILVENALDTNKIIVSCIWWKDMGEFVITSVDTINLLERLVGTKFTTEEKNRIRRNLQGFKPATVSKSQPESEPFFRTLMEFPPPRPRNIEKDVKAFAWSKLPSMLEKVISKYWFVSSPNSSEADESSPRVRILREMDGASTESPGASFQSLSTSQTPSSAQPSQAEVEPMYTGIIDPSSYMSAHSSSQAQHEEYRPPAHEHQIGYPHSSQSSSDSTYARSNRLMEINEVSMQELQSVPMGSNQPSTEYEDMEAYPEAMGVLDPGSTYMHQVGEEMQYVTHTSHEYA